MNLIITIVVVVGYFLLFGRKRKKVVPPEKHSREPETEPTPKSIFEELQPEMVEPEILESAIFENENNTEIYPKNENYFTYESLPKEEMRMEEKSVNNSMQSVDEKAQIVDTQKENNSLFDVNADDLVKGVIYSEILQRPYN